MLFSRVLSVFIFPAVLLFSPLAFSRDGGFVFIDFAKDHLEEEYENTLGQQWEKRIIKHSERWTEEEAVEFLNFLNKRIEKEATVKRLKSTSYFSHMRFKSFKERVKFFSGYIGREGVNHRLRRSLGGFHRGNIEEMEGVIEFIEGYIGTEGVKERMKQDLRGFSDAKLTELEKVVEFIEGYIEREGVKERMQQDLQGFSNAKLTELKQVVAFIEGYIGTEGVKERMKQDLRGFSDAKLTELEKVVEFIEGYIGREGVKKRMQQDLQGFFQRQTH